MLWSGGKLELTNAEGVSVSPENVVEPPPDPQAPNTKAFPAPFPCTHSLAVIAAWEYR